MKILQKIFFVCNNNSESHAQKNTVRSQFWILRHLHKAKVFFPVEVLEVFGNSNNTDRKSFNFWIFKVSTVTFWSKLQKLVKSDWLNLLKKYKTKRNQYNIIHPNVFGLTHQNLNYNSYWQNIWNVMEKTNLQILQRNF